MKPRTHVGAALLCAILCLNSSLRAGDAPAANAPAQAGGAQSSLRASELLKLRDADRVLGAFAEGNQTVRVMVKLNEPAEKHAVSWENKNSVAVMHRAIAQVQDRAIGRHAPADLKLRHKYENHAGFSAEITWAALQQLLSDADVVAVEPVTEMKPHLAQGLPLMNGMVYRTNYNGAGVAIAICDTGVDYRHPRLGNGGFPNSKVIGGRDVADNDPNPLPVGSDISMAHGTACAGLAAGDLGTVGDYIGGVAPSARLYALKIVQDNEPFSADDIIAAAWDWCVTHRNDDTNNPLLVISTSFGGGRYFSACDSLAANLAAAANSAVSAGITLLVSSGNDGYCDSIASPACISGVIAVGAVYDAGIGTSLWCVDSGSCLNKIFTLGCSTFYYTVDQSAPDKVTAYSNTSAQLGVLAPSNDAYTTDIVGSGGYSLGDYDGTFGGTSAASPYAAGAVACLQSAAKARLGRYLTPAEVRTRLTTTGDNIYDPKGNITKPRVNLGRAIDSLVLTHSFSVSANLLTETCSPTNRAIDPGEVVNMRFTLRNVGSLNETNVTVTLLAGAGVLNPSAPQPYSLLVANGASVQPTFSFTASGVCGGTLTNTVLIQENGSNISTLQFTWPIGSQSIALKQNFDTVLPPALPTNWSMYAASGNNGWLTTTQIFDSATNSAFVADPSSVSDVLLVSPAFPVSSTNAQLTFAHKYKTEYGFDGGVLEISINNGPFTDIVAAGGSFQANGYNFNIDSGFGSPLAGRNAWTGNSGTNLATTVVTLPWSAANTTVRLRWRMATDGTLAADGWYVDSVAVSDRTCCRPPVPMILYTQRQGSRIVFAYNSKLGMNYQIEYKDTLAAPWTPLMVDVGNGFMRWMTNSLAPSQRFFRLHEL